MTGVEVLSESLGGAPLARVLIDGRMRGDGVPGWFAPTLEGVEAWRGAALVAAAATAGGWSEALAPAIDARGAAADRLARVVASGGALVTTGQQPGLFGGPLYTWWKALSALALADEIERCTGIATAPLFWAATDDTDFAEAASTVVAETDGARELRIAPALPPGPMMSEMPIGDVGDALYGLLRACGSAIDPRTVEAVTKAYGAPGATVGGAYVTLLRSILAPLGIPVLDAAHPAVSRRGHAILERALTSAGSLAAAVKARDAEITTAGFAPQVPEVPSLSLVFHRSAAGKQRVPIADSARQASTARPGSLSPNVLLRPVLEAAILPTVAYVAGPGEIAYFAQVGAVADSLGIRIPRAVPRWSGTIVEPHVRDILDEFGFAVDDLRDPHAAESTAARAHIPQASAQASASVADALQSTLGDLRAAAALDALPMPLSAIDGLERDLARRLERFERRMVAATKRRIADRLARIARARGALFPFGKRQERGLNVIPLLARHGTQLFDDVLSPVRAHAREVIG